MKRIILYTGKGGVGKTTAAAATALQSAKRGYKTLVISTDPAHSLRDSFDIDIGPEPKKIAKNLYAQEIDVFYSVDKYWGKLTGYIQSLFNWMKVDDVLAEEFSIFPGMEEVSCFLWVYSHYKEGDYDVIIVDSAPTGETLRLLSLPDVARTLNNLGILHSVQNRMDEARQAYEEALGTYLRFAERDPEQFRADVARLESLLKALPR